MGRGRMAAAALAALLASALLSTPATAAVSAGQRCTATQGYRTIKVKATTLQCLPSNGKWSWKRVTKPVRRPPSNPIKASALAALITHRQGSCTATAPRDWALLPDAQSSAADLVSPDRTLTASWGMIVVPAVVGGFGTLPPYDNPNAYSSDAATALLAHLRYYESAENPAADLHYTDDPAEQFGAYTARTMRSSRNTVVALYTRFPGDGWSSKYVLVVRLAKATNAQWASQGGKVAHYALSIQCITQLSPERDTAPDPKDRKQTAADEAQDEGYNPWLGTEYVHNPSTGTNYTVTPKQWSDNGPNGPGYYLADGNFVVQLAPGRSPQ